MWVNQRDATPFFDILKNEVAKQGGLARAGLPNDVSVLPPRGQTQSERNVTTPFVPMPEIHLFIVGFHPIKPLRRERIPPPKRAPSFALRWNDSKRLLRAAMVIEDGLETNKGTTIISHFVLACPPTTPSFATGFACRSGASLQHSGWQSQN